MQLPEPSTLEALLKVLASPAAGGATFLVFVLVFRRLLIPKANGRQAEQAKELSDAHTKEVLYKLDLALTEHFDQLRRDLEMKISISQGQTEKIIDNSITAFLFRQELERRGRKAR